MSTALTISRFSIQELVDIARQANVLKLMGANKLREVIVDYCPARQSVALARKTADDVLEVYKPVVTPLVFRLEDAMFGGSIFVALVCGDRVVVAPFAWKSYEHLTQVAINV